MRRDHYLPLSKWLHSNLAFGLLLLKHRRQFCSLDALAFGNTARAFQRGCLGKVILNNKSAEANGIASYVQSLTARHPSWDKTPTPRA